MFIRLILLLPFFWPGGELTAQAAYDRYLRAYQLNEVGAPVVTSIFKDSKGFMWFGSPNGLYCWDGYNVRLYRHNSVNENSLLEDPIRSILFEDRQGSIWLSTLSQGIHRYDRAKDEIYPVSLYDKSGGRLPYDQVHWACQDTVGNIWGIAVGHIFFKYDQAAGMAKLLPVDSSSPFRPSNSVLSAMPDKSGKFFWIGTSGGVLQYHIGEERYKTVEIPPVIGGALQKAAVNAIIQDSKGVCWFGTTSGLFRFDVMNNEWRQFKHHASGNCLSSDKILSLSLNVLDNGSSLWIFTGDGLDRFVPPDNVFLHYYLDERKLKFTYTPFISVDHYDYFDDKGFLWLATDNQGPVMINLKEIPFSQYPVVDKLGNSDHQDATAFLHDRNGDLWIGTGFRGLFHYDRNQNLSEIFRHDPHDDLSLSNNFVHVIFEDHRGNLWIGTENGLNRLDRGSGTFQRYLTDPIPGGLPHIRIADLCQDQGHRLWVGTSQGVYYTQQPDSRVVPFSSCQEIPMLYITVHRILPDRRGNIWFLTPIKFGLYCLTGVGTPDEKMIHYQVDEKDPGGFFTDGALCMHEDLKGNYWLGTTRGLYQWNPEDGQIKHFDNGNGLGANLIFWIEADGRGNFWLSTEHGLLRFNPESESERMVKKYTGRDGLPFEKMYTWRYYKTQDGWFYIGGSLGSGHGYYIFHPDLLPDNQSVPPISMTNFKVRNEAFPLDSSISEKKHIHLKSNQNYFSFEFAAMDYLDPGMNRYAYMLDGFDADWIYCGSRRFANYTGVPTGDYVFRVKGSNNDGYWNEEGASVKLTILSPPQRSWWANVLYALFVIGVAASIAWYYLKRQQLRHALEIGELQKKQVEETSRMKSRFFANISHEFRTPLTLILGPIEKLKANTRDRHCIEDLNVMQRNARRLQRLIDQLLSLSKIEAGQMKVNAREGDIVAFTKGYIQSFESAARQKEIRLSFQADPPEIRIWFDRDKIEKILYNLLSNAFKFTSEGGRVSVTVDSRQSSVHNDRSTEDCQLPTADLPAECVSISIADTGPGISPMHLPHIFDRFYQANNSDARFQEGTGIGLALAKELAELHHGKITVESELGEGTTFTVLLPLGRKHLGHGEKVGRGEEELEAFEFWNVEPATQNSKLKTQNPELRTQNSERRTDKPLLLVVEDNPDMRFYIRSLLDKEYQMLEAADGFAGNEIALEQIPDLVVADVMMPRIDGYELCRRLKHDVRTSHIPVVLLTSKVGLEDKLEGLQTGADDFVTKPFQPAELMARIGNLIRQRQMLREKFRMEFEHAQRIPENSMTDMEASFMQKARKVVGDNLSDPDFGIQDFSLQMNMSRTQLHRKLHALFNLSATEFIRTYRLNHAARLLKAGEGNVTQVAFEVGFNNLSYFSKCFQKQFGVKPSDYLSR